MSDNQPIRDPQSGAIFVRFYRALEGPAVSILGSLGIGVAVAGLMAGEWKYLDLGTFLIAVSIFIKLNPTPDP